MGEGDKRTGSRARGTGGGARGTGGGARSSRELHEALPEPMRDAADGFARELAGVHNRSAHTVRAYL
ncbi:MAG TPA: hypothetical protein VHI50_04035, partial [Micromonosporaceae bacterium]|nr:hypothetical protein [Micromonosporaceae bacterium]